MNTTSALLAIALCLVIFTWGMVEQFEDMEEARVIDQQAACKVAELDYEGNSLCYQDPSCMITGEDFRMQLHTDDYLKENCPDEWKASKGTTQSAPVSQAHPGLDIWSGVTERWTPSVSSTN